jgi:hypothetical protein
MSDDYDGVIQAEDIDPAVRNKVKDLTSEVRFSREKWADAFNGMRADSRFHYGIQWAGQHSIYKETRYIANLTQQNVRKKVDALYPKDPTFTAGRRQKMDFLIWDEDIATLQQVQQRIATGLVTPEDMQLVMDVQQGLQKRKLLDRVGRTMELGFDHFISEQTPSFKVQMKRLARRAVVCGVSYLKLGFQRVDPTAEIRESRIADAREQIARLERLLKEQSLPDANPERAELAEMRAMLKELMAKQPVMREGPVFDFPQSWNIIPDAETVSINGWLGTRFVAEQFMWRKSRVKEKFKVNVGCNYKAYVSGDMGLQEDQRFWEFQKLNGATGKEDPLVCWWYVYDKRSGLVYTIADGYEGYLAEPRAPDVSTEQFFPYYALMTNDVEADGHIFPPSDVRMFRSMQEEYNRKREAVRQHRIANRPLYVMAGELVDKDDAANLATDYPDHSILKMASLKEGMKASDLLQAIQKAPVDPTLYETETDFSDMQRTSGLPSPVIGDLSGATATENSIADTARAGSAESNVDDLDNVLNAVARDTGILMLREMSFETMKEICGPGAIWPELTGADVARELFLKVEGSGSGRAHAARQAAAVERVGPLLMQIPGIKPEFLGRRVLRAVDPDMDLTDAFDMTLPSITAMNAIAGKPGTQPGSGENDPGAQGDEGGDNRPAPEGMAPGGQPAFPAPTMAPT